MRSARIIKLSFKIEDRQLWIILFKVIFRFFQIPLLLKKKTKNTKQIVKYNKMFSFKKIFLVDILFDSINKISEKKKRKNR